MGPAAKCQDRPEQVLRVVAQTQTADLDYAGHCGCVEPLSMARRKIQFLLFSFVFQELLWLEKSVHYTLGLIQVCSPKLSHNQAFYLLSLLMPQKLNLVTVLKSVIYQALPLCQAEPQAALYFYIYHFSVCEMSALHRQLQRVLEPTLGHGAMQVIKTGVKPQVCLTIKLLLFWLVLGI